jgi:hypothetical protein
VQDKPSMHQNSTELTRNFGLVLCTILTQVAWPALFIFIITGAHRHLTQDCWVWLYSGFASGEEVCFVTAILWGAGYVHTPALPLFCHCTSLVVSVEGHHQTCQPLESLTARCIVMTKCMPVFEGVLLRFHIFNCSGALAMTHLSCCIIPLLSVSLPQHI